jgi:hypothetical protein
MSKTTIAARVLSKSGLHILGLHDGLSDTQASNLSPLRHAMWTERISCLVFLETREFRPSSRCLSHESDCRERTALAASGLEEAFSSAVAMTSPTFEELLGLRNQMNRESKLDFRVFQVHLPAAISRRFAK